MSDDVAVVWLAEPEAREDAERALEAWARPRDVRLTRPVERETTSGAEADARTQVARALEDAREAMSALDTARATRALAAAEAGILAHPELPEGAWLLAEIQRGWATRWARLEPRDDARAATAWRAAETLDGGRVPGVGERAFGGPLEARTVHVVVRGRLPKRATVRIDARPVTSRASAAGLEVDVPLASDVHHVYVDHDGHRLAAVWATVTQGEAGPGLVVGADEGDLCDARELARVRREGTGVVATGVSCASWIAVVPESTPGALLIARCDEDACGSLVPWRTSRPVPHDPVVTAPSRWPAWASWTIAGVLAGAATTAGVVASGVLESRPATPRFVGGGVRLE